jgi:peptidoglycan hydrolase CwlO-like protein
MKKFFKALTIIAAILSLAGFTTIITMDVINNPSSLNEWYATYLEPKLLTFSISSFISWLAAWALSRATGWVQQAVEKLADANTKVNSTLEENAALQSELKQLQSQLAGVQETLQTIREISKIAFMNSPELVKNGYARKIAEVLSDEKTD